MKKLKTISPSQLERMKISWAKTDTSNSGHCSKIELSVIMTDLGRPPTSTAELDMLFSKTDTDSSGEVTFAEFVDMMVTQVGFMATPGVLVTLKSFLAVGPKFRPTIDLLLLDGHSTAINVKPKKKDPIAEKRKSESQRRREKAEKSVQFESEVFLLAGALFLRHVAPKVSLGSGCFHCSARAGFT